MRTLACLALAVLFTLSPSLYAAAPRVKVEAKSGLSTMATVMGSQ